MCADLASSDKLKVVTGEKTLSYLEYSELIEMAKAEVPSQAQFNKV